MVINLFVTFVDGWWGNGPNPQLTFFEGRNIIMARRVGEPFGFQCGVAIDQHTDSYVYALNGKWKIGDNLMHRDAKPLIALLGQHNVKLCVSGHIHLLDHVRYMGVDFICDGAVSGNWWGGPFQECSEGYGVLDFYPDGTFGHRYVTYGWNAPK